MALVVGEAAMDVEAMTEATIGVDTLLEAEATAEAIEADQEDTLRTRPLNLIWCLCIDIETFGTVRRGFRLLKPKALRLRGAQEIGTKVSTIDKTAQG